MARLAGQDMEANAAGDVLSLTVAGERMALAASDVAEIIRARPVTRVPHAPASLLGVLNLRGAALPVLSAAALLGRPAGEASAATRIVVLVRGAAAGGGRLGLLVDSVASLRPMNGETLLDIEALLARDFGARAGGAAARGVGPGPGAAASTQEAAEPARAERREQALIAFALAGQDYALALTDVTEVTALPLEIAALPGSDAAMLGAAPWRGDVLPVVSLRVLLGLPAAFDRQRARMVVLRVGGAPVGLAVDGLREILRVDDQCLEPVPEILSRGGGEARVKALCRLDGGRRLISLLSPEHVFDARTHAGILARREAAPDTAQATPGDGMSGMSDAPQQFVVFQLGDEHYGLPIAAVDEVVRRPDTLTRVPRAPAFLEGVMNLRGRAVPVINQSQRFALPGDTSRQGRIVIVTIDGLQAGFVVDSVSEVLSVAGGDLQPAPALAADGAPLFDRIATVIRGAARPGTQDAARPGTRDGGNDGVAGGRMILLIDPRALLDRAERDVLAAISASVPVESGQAGAALVS